MKINKKVLLTLFIAMLTIFCINSKVEATYSATGKTVDSGASVSITIESTKELENFDIECIDTGGLTYKTCATSVQGAILNPEAKKISYAAYGGKAKTLGTYTFTAPVVDKQMNYTVKFDVNGETIISTITVKAEEPKDDDKNQNHDGDAGNQNPSSASNNAYLSTLGVTPKQYDFSGFKKTKMDYSVTVPYEVDSLKVLYKTADSNSKVKVTGNSGFKVGSDNKITIVVTAQDEKTTQIYTITVTKLAQKEETTITPEEPKEKSTNAYLSTLGVTPKEYDFSGFKKTKMDYSVTIPYEMDSLKVLYKTVDSKATVKVTGDSGFVVGSDNKITIKVTAEDGKTTKTYTIKVTKLAEEEEKPGNIIDEEIEGLYLTSLSIKGIEISPKFEKETYAYTATLEDTDLTEIEVKAEANKENASIEISGNTNLVVGENTINIVVKQEESSAQAVYQITLKKVAELTTTTDIQDSNFMSSLIDNIKNYVIIAVAVVVLIIVVIITLIVLLRKENKRLRKETEEDNVYENDENEFESNKEEIVNEPVIEETTNETETKNERRTRRKEKGRHSK